MTSPAPDERRSAPAFEKPGLDGYGPEVRAHFKFVLKSIAVGVVLMGATAIWAWNHYADRLAEAPPLPSGAPPLSSVPATTR
jgi:hypothetical protein